MKSSFLLILFFPIGILLFGAANNHESGSASTFEDSTLHQRFIMSVLNDYEMEGRWFFIRIDSVYKLKDNYELIHPQTLYNSYSSQFTTYNKTRFLFNAYETLTHHSVMERYPELPLLKGVKVNMGIYRSLLSKPKEKILSTCFNADKTLKSQYKKWLYEIIAVCYTNNVKVITPDNAPVYYEVFK